MNSLAYNKSKSLLFLLVMLLQISCNNQSSDYEQKDKSSVTQELSAREKENIEIDEMRKAASRKVSDIFSKSFTKCENSWTTKIRQEISDTVLDEKGKSRFLPIYWYAEFREMEGLDAESGDIREFTGSNKLNHPEVKWEIVFRVRAKFKRNTTYEQVNYASAASAPENAVPIVRYDTGKWGEWQNFDMDIFNVTFWKTTTGRLEMKENKVSNPVLHDAPNNTVFMISYENAKFIKTSCGEAKSIVHDKVD